MGNEPIDPVESFAQVGFVLRRGLLDHVLPDLASIAGRIHGLWMAEHGEEAAKHHLVNSHGLTHPDYFPPPFAEERLKLFDALADEASCQLVHNQVGADFHFHGTQLFFNPVGGVRRPYWHRDLQYVGLDEQRQEALLSELTHLHLRIPLRPETGFMLVPGSHKRWDSDPERKVRLELAGHRSHEDLSSARRFDLLPGDVLLFHAHMLHRGTYAGNEERLSLDLMLARPHPEVPVASDVAQLPTSMELPKITHAAWYARARDLADQAAGA